MGFFAAGRSDSASDDSGTEKNHDRRHERDDQHRRINVFEMAANVAYAKKQRHRQRRQRNQHDHNR
jgi:hypothetical protein